MKKSELFFSAILVPIDYLMIVLAALAAYSLRFGETVAEIRPVLYELPFGEFLNIAFLIALVWILIFALAGLYSMRGTRKIRPELTRIFFAISTGVLIVILAFFFRREFFSSRFIIIATWIFAVIFVAFGRIIIRLIQQSLFKIGYGVHRIVVVGDDQNTENVVETIKNKPRLGFTIVGRVKNFNENSKKEIQKIIKQKGIDEIFQTDLDLSKQEQLDLISFTSESHLTYRYAADLLRTQAVNIKMTTIGGVPIFEVEKTPLEGWGKIAKRIFDIVASLILIIITLPIMILVALAIKIDSRGPIFFKYRRIGRHGKPFTFVKFRSMIKDAHKMKPSLLKKSERKEGGPLFKLKNDPRVTRVGKFIRRWSLDELPQFFLVLKGNMSLVGPRPHEMEEVSKYKKDHKRVLEIKPGITGMAQVSGRSDLSFEEEVRLDTHYITNWSLMLDIIILIKTPWAVIRKRETI